MEPVGTGWTGPMERRLEEKVGSRASRSMNWVRVDEGCEDGVEGDGCTVGPGVGRDWGGG